MIDYGSRGEKRKGAGRENIAENGLIRRLMISESITMSRL